MYGWSFAAKTHELFIAVNDVILFWNHNSSSKQANPSDYFLEYPVDKDRFLNE